MNEEEQIDTQLDRALAELEQDTTEVAAAVDAEVATFLPPPKEPDKPKAEPIRLTLERCSRVMGELERKQCYVFDTSFSYRQYLKPLGMGYTHDLAEAHRYTPRQAIQQWGQSTRFLIELIDQDLALDISTRKLPKCSIEQALRASLIELLKLAPLNPTARACIMRETTKMPPDSCKTYEELKEWIEENCEPRMSPDGIRRAQQAAAPTVGVDFYALVQAVAQGVAFTVSLKFTDREYGHATYYQRRESEEDYQVSAEQVSSAVDRAIAQGLTMLSDIVTLLKSYITEDAWNTEPEMEEVGDPFHDHDGMEGTDRRLVVPYSEASFRENLRDYLRATLPPEQAARIEGL